MEPASIDLDPQQFLQSDITKMYLTAKVVEQGKLTWFVGSLEHHRVETEAFSKPVCEGTIEVPVLVKQTAPACALSGFYNQFYGARIEPLLPLGDQRIHHSVAEFSRVLFAEFELNFQAPFTRHPNDMRWTAGQSCKSFSAFDAGDADVSTEVQVGRQLILCHRNLEGAS